MSNSTNPTTPIPRGQWLRMLQALPPEVIRAGVEAINESCQIEDMVLPSAGLALLPQREGALGEAYYLGEVPYARAQVTVRDGDGKVGEGAAQIIDDRAELARDLAVCDAVLAHGLAGHVEIAALLDQGAAKIAETDAARKSILKHTRVDFSLLNTASEEDDDEN
ncbi:MAG: phosphonate C-P lyase system protein PhnG [Opitutales bacterium]